MQARNNLGGSTKGPGPEKKLEDLVKFSLGVCFPEKHAIWKNHGTEFSPPGIPDFIGHIRGTFFAVELKVAPNRPSGDQIRKIQHFNKTGPKSIVGVLIQEDDSFYFVYPAQLAPFSYRDRLSWVKLQVRQYIHPRTQETQPFLDLRPLPSFFLLDQE